jgi:lactam utilization protein B
MEFIDINEETAESHAALRIYSKPTLVKLGSVADITAGHHGSKIDVSTPGIIIPTP